MPIKCLSAICATSTEVKRLLISFDTESGLIVDVSKVLKPKDQVDYFFDDDCLLFAGMGDVHIHAREDISGKNNYKEDFISTGCACINGGLAHAADMPNNPVPPIDDEAYLAKAELSRKSPVPLLLYAGIGPKTKPLSFKVPYKVYMGPSIGDLFFKDHAELEETLKNYESQWVSFHCEDPVILEQHKTRPDHFSRRPIVAEVMATDVALKLIEKFKLKGKLCHYSAGAGLMAIKKAKASGINVTCEVTPQHLYLSEEDLRLMPQAQQVLYQMNPPIRPRADADLLLEALRNNEIDFLATDHAPHSQEEKKQGISGMPGLDTFGPFVTWLICEKGIAPQVISKVASENPGRFFNEFLSSVNEAAKRENLWGKGLGFLEAGHSATFSILNLKKPQTITVDKLATKARWSPFLNVTFPGSVEALFLRGEVRK